MTPGILEAAAICGALCGMTGGAGLAVAASRRRRRQPQRDATVRAALYRALADPAHSDRIVEDLGPADRKLLEAKSRALLPALRGEDRETLAGLLERRGASEVARRGCRSRRATTRAEACQILGDLGSSFAVLDLVPLLDDARWPVRLAAARALGRLGQPAAVVPLLQVGDWPHPLPVDVAADAIQAIRGWPISLLQPSLSDPSDRTRALAVELLGRLRALDCIDVLLATLGGDPSLAVKVRAARALGLLQTPRAIHPLIAAVASGPVPLQVEAARALGRLGAPTGVPVLRGALLGVSRPVSDAAADALAAIGPEGVAVLHEVADDHRHPAAPVARHALDAAGVGVTAPSTPGG